jgi:hypothetical protein
MKRELDYANGELSRGHSRMAFVSFLCVMGAVIVVASVVRGR